METDPSPTPGPARNSGADCLKLMLTLMAVVLFAIMIVDWDDFKTGFTEGYHRAAGR